MKWNLVPGLARPPFAIRQPGSALRLAAAAAALTYLALFSAYLLVSGGWPTPDYLIPPLLLFAIAIGRGWSFLFDWAPFLVLILAWQASAGIANQVGYPLHVNQMIIADRWLFRGHLPTVELQQRLYHPGAPRWYDWLGAGQHAAHFALPIAFGVVLWLRGRRLYWRYIASLMTALGLGYTGYVLYPAAPPWMAAQEGLIPPVHRVAVETMQRFAATRPIGLAYLHMNANPVGAMPSLHAALPMLVALVAVRLWGRWATPAFLYALAMGYNAVYLGEHYAVDVLAGYAVAVVAFLLTWVLPQRLPASLTAWRAPALRVPVGVRRLGDAALLASAVAALVVIGASLRPPSPTEAPAASAGRVPAFATPAPDVNSLATPPCAGPDVDAAAAPELMQGVAEEYAVYLIDLVDTSCYALAANPTLPPPGDEARFELASQPTATPEPDTMLPGTDVVIAQTGAPGPALAGSGLPADHRYLLVVRLEDIADSADAARAVHTLQAMVLRTGG